MSRDHRPAMLADRIAEQLRATVLRLIETGVIEPGGQFRDPTDPSTDIENANVAYRLMAEERDRLLAVLGPLVEAAEAFWGEAHIEDDALNVRLADELELAIIAARAVLDGDPSGAGGPPPA